MFLESGGDNLAASFSPELVDASIYVIDVAGGDKIPRKGGPGVTRSDLLVINKIDLAPHVGADLDVMARDASAVRGERPFVFTNLKTGDGVADDHRVDRARTAVRPMTARADDRAGRPRSGGSARLELMFDVRNGRTVLAHGYAEPPLRIGRCFDEGRGVHLILASSAPGVFGGDRMQHVVRARCRRGGPADVAIGDAAACLAVGRAGVARQPVRDRVRCRVDMRMAPVNSVRRRLDR